MENHEKNENFEICKRISDELDKYTDGAHYKCPHCRALITRENKHDGAYGFPAYTCPECGEDFDEYDVNKPVTIYDYFADNEIFDIKYTIDENFDFCGARAMITFGGPNIYINTERESIMLRWWNESAEYSLTSSTAETVEDYFRERYNYARERYNYARDAH